jgi:hypothetical protein
MHRFGSVLSVAVLLNHLTGTASFLLPNQVLSRIFSKSVAIKTVWTPSLWSKNDDSDDHFSSPPIVPILERLRVAGVSVSSKGFHVMLQKSSTSSTDACYLPLQVTGGITDAIEATSPESLTLCQLLSGVDMAGAILPPELLSKLVVYHVEDQKHNDHDDSIPAAAAVAQRILDDIQASLSEFPQAGDTYKDAHEWVQSRIRLPQVTLDQLTLIPSLKKNKLQWRCRLECALPEWKEQMVLRDVQPEFLKSLAFNYDPDTSLLFTCVALSLRYKAPIVLEVPSEDSDSVNDAYTRSLLTMQQLDQQFPQRTTVGKLQQQSTRVAENIERGFEIHKLQGALTIAMKMGDEKAVEKIRAKLDEYDSMQDLPTTLTRTNTDKDEEDGESLDDLDKNILQ